MKQDTPEQIAICQQCKWPECVNCLDKRTRKTAPRGKAQQSGLAVPAKRRAHRKSEWQPVLESGIPDYRIAQHFGVSRSTVARWHKELIEEEEHV